MTPLHGRLRKVRMSKHYPDRVAVSVIIPVHNTEKYLKSCLDSVQQQTLHEFECLCVDDGSSDGSWDILKTYESSDGRFRVLKNAGETAGGARNTGIDEARGEYIICLDSDDFFEPDLLRALYERAKAGDLDLAVCCADSYLDEEKRFDVAAGVVRADLWRRMGGRAFCPHADMPETMFQLVSASPWNKLWKASFVRERGLRYQSLRNSNDTLFSYMGLMQARRVALVDKVLVHWRVRRHSLSRGYDQHPDCFIDSLSALASGVAQHLSAQTAWPSLMELCADVTTWRINALPLSRQPEVRVAVSGRLEPVLHMLPYIAKSSKENGWDRKCSRTILQFKQYAAMLAPQRTYVVPLDMRWRGSWKMLRRLRRVLPFFSNAIVVIVRTLPEREEALLSWERLLPEHLFIHRYDAARYARGMRRLPDYLAAGVYGWRCGRPSRLASPESLTPAYIEELSPLSRCCMQVMTHRLVRFLWR